MNGIVYVNEIKLKLQLKQKEESWRLKFNRVGAFIFTYI